MASLYCPLCCDQPFDDQQSLFFHLRGLRNNLFCPVCAERFPSLELLVTHLSRKCHGPQKPSEAKRRCLTNISYSDKNDVEDEVLIKENRPSASPVNLQSPSTIPFEIPGRLLRNISISIKEPVEKSPQKQTIGVNYSNPIVLAVDPKNPNITNGLPLQSVVLSSNVDTTDDNEPSSTSLNITSNANMPAKDTSSSNFSPKQSLTNCSSTCLNSTTKLHSKSKINKESDVEGQEGVKTLSSITANIDSSTQLVKSMVTTNSVGLSNHTDQKIIEQASQYLQDVSKKKRGRPRKNKNLEISNDAVTSYNGKEITPQKTNAKQNVDKGALKHVKPSLNDSDDDNDHFEESMDQNDSQPVEDQTASNVEISVQNNKADTNKENEDTKAAEEEEEYVCSACDIRFTSIYEHIKQFHNGEEVVVEVPEEEINKDLKAYQGEGGVSVQQNDLPINSDTTSLAAKDDELAVEVTKSTVVSTEEEVQIVTEADNHQEKSISSKNSHATPQIQSLWPTSLNKNYSKQVHKLNKSGEWLRTKGSKRSCFHYVTDKYKMVRVLSELKDNCKYHPDFKVPIKEMFENPKINVVSITNEPNTPFFTYKEVDLSKPIPMFVVVRQSSEPDTILGGIASYVLANPCRNSSHVEDSKVIAVMKVFLGSDPTITVENLVFKNKPAIESMIPVLEDISEPEIPLLNGGKMLKWKCNKCMTSTWKFPLSKDSHMCNGCTICHKPFVTSIALKKHMFVHKKNISNYCEKCHLAFLSCKVMETHQAEHENHNLCPMCNLFVPLRQKEAHEQLHSRLPVNQFPCSVCHKMFASGEEVKAHQTKTCGRLVAKYNCFSCDKKFFSLTALSYHTRDHRNINIKFPCRFCQKTFIKEKEQCPRKAGKRKPSSYLQKIWHERIHTRERPFLCSACPKRFRSRDHQTLHSNQAHCSSRHKDVPIYMCNICDELFQNALKLETHKKEKHMLQQPT